jgi:AcrR family transcriptional regulator
MGRAGLTPDLVTKAAGDLVNREGRAGLTLARLASELGVRSPSLYNHVGGLEDLERLVALDGIDQLAEVCRAAVMGKARSDALRALAVAYRGFAKAQPGVYSLTQIARPEDPEFGERAARVLEPVTAVLGGFGLEGDALIHAVRSLRAALHGFANLETGNGFGLDVDVEESFEWLVAMVDRSLSGIGQS